MTQNPPRILVVRLGAMGDIVHALPAVASLKQGFPGAHLTWVVEPQWAALLEGNPFVDRVILLRRRDASRRVGHRCANYAPPRSISRWISRDCSSPPWWPPPRAPSAFSAGTAANCARPRPASSIPTALRARAAHVVDRNLDLAAAAGARRRSRIFPLPAGQPEAPLPEGAFVLASPLAGWRAKQWPLENYLALGGLLRRECKLTLVLNGPPGSLDGLAGGSACPTLQCWWGRRFRLPTERRLAARLRAARFNRCHPPCRRRGRRGQRTHAPGRGARQARRRAVWSH